MIKCTLGRKSVCCTRIENLKVKIGKDTILEDINLHLHCGELTAVVGKNGAGKSTFMKALLNVIPHTGRIIFEGEKCNGNCGKEHTANHSEFCNIQTSTRFVTSKPRFGYVPQSLSVDQDSPVSVEDLVLSCTTKRPVWMRHRKQDREKVLRILATTKAEHLATSRVSTLSGGELQRVMLALAINPLPDILILDEPVSGVDHVGLKHFYELVSSLRRNYDITILLVSHDLDLVAQHADKVIFINDRKAYSGSVEKIYGREDFKEAFGHFALPKSRNENQVEETPGEN